MFNIQKTMHYLSFTMKHEASSGPQVSLSQCAALPDAAYVYQGQLLYIFEQTCVAAVSNRQTIYVSCMDFTRCRFSSVTDNDVM